MVLRFTILAAIVVGCVLARSSRDSSGLRSKEAYAVRVTTPPRIDGRIDELEWSQAVPITDFLQVEPDNLEVPTERTEVRILYTDEYLYIGFSNYDSAPERVVRRLTRRDAWQEGFADNADWVGVGLDTRDDDQTAYFLAVNAAGVQLDVYVSRDRDYDSSWDGVWKVAVDSDAVGWFAEFRIPFSLFQFPSVSALLWGLELNRGIQRKQERSEWPGKPRGVQGIVSRYGILQGLENIPAPRQVNLLPYALGGYHEMGTSEVSRSMGLDLEYGLLSNTTLQLAFNPDFGQVEADPSVLNLTAFETFYQEKRPFFVQGSGFFDNRIQLFNSRRIGRRPGYFSPDQGIILDRPEATTILGATKITGKTNSGLGFGVIESITDQEFGIHQYTRGDTTVRENFLLEPYSNYFVGRMEKPLFNEVSTLGLALTDLRRRGGVDAAVLGSDWDFNFHDNRLRFSGQAAVSIRGGVQGHAGRFYLGYRDPTWWDLNLTAGGYDERFEINDLGFLRRNDLGWVGIFGGVRKQDPWGPFLNNNLSIRFFRRFRTRDALDLTRTLGLDQTNLLKNYWSFGFEGRFRFPAYEDGDRFKDERAWEIATPFNWEGAAWIQSDRRRRIIARTAYRQGNSALGEENWTAQVDLTLKPTDYLQLAVTAQRRQQVTALEWVGVVEDSTDAAIIYSRSWQRVDDIQLRLNWTFSPTLSLEAYLQPFRVDMDYYHFQRLLKPRTYRLEDYPYDGDPDFKIDNTVGTFVLRWEYLRGSTLFVVYNLKDNNYYDSLPGSWYPSESSSLVIKLNYWFQV